MTDLVQVLVDVVAGDGRVRDKLEQLPDGHHCYTVFLEKV